MDIKERDTLIATDYMGGKSVPLLAKEHGLSVPSINRVLEQAGVDRSKRAERVREPGPIDFLHERVGQRLYNHRRFVEGKERNDVAEKLNWSVKKVAQVETGKTPLSLYDIQAIAGYMKQTMSRLLEEL